ncbi:protein phosphatase inhibitor 2-like [Clytia hemisphaerica]|uniref:Protein phosphatase inhibitor 2 n=1 Tax=Clytia hemisphaerica TaxID=252671 RepID=A0A7M5UYZ5_9CNID
MAEAKPTTSPTPKGILKHNHEHNPHPEVKFDEMNILETYHPANKDYGHMKIDEPPTPYNHEFSEGEEGAEGGSSAGSGVSGVDASLLAGKLESTESRKDHQSESENEDDDDEHLSEAAKLKKKAFSSKRKNHYNEFTNVQKAREMIAKELAELEDDN